MGNQIPPLSRRLVKTRDQGRCVRCGSPARNGQWHHRRSRGERLPHRHCPCNGVWLCPTCHRFVHQNPASAQDTGFIVRRHIEDPRTVPTSTWYGLVIFDCDGFFNHVGDTVEF